MSRPYASESAFRAIADPIRRRIIELLLAGEKSGIDLLRELNVTQPTLSHHLSILRSAGIVTQKRSGRGRVYGLHAAPLRAPADWLRRCRV